MTKQNRRASRYSNKLSEKCNLVSLRELGNILEANPKIIIDVFVQEEKILIQGATMELFGIDGDWPRALSMIKNEIKTRPDPEDRIEYWECIDGDGKYSFEKEKNLLKVRSNLRAIKTKKTAKRTKKQDLYRLCDHFGMHRDMADLFLSELKLSTSPGDTPAKEHARMLGLMR